MNFYDPSVSPIPEPTTLLTSDPTQTYRLECGYRELGKRSCGETVL